MHHRRRVTPEYPGLYTYLNHYPDECKPPIPYEVGSQLTAVAFDPPKGLLKDPEDWFIQAKGQVREDLQNLSPLRACLQHPPAEGILGALSVQLRILEHIRVSDLKNSQILKVEASMVGDAPSPDSSHRYSNGAPVTPPQSGTIVAAKLYDPLYVDLDDCWPDPFHNCDAALSLETEAYRNYLRPLYGTYVPHFYGSYTINVPVPHDTQFWLSNFEKDQMEGPRTRTRPVRAILYEYIPGISLDSAMEDQIFNQLQRKEIMRALITADSKMRQLDVLIERDFMPRNVVVTSAEEGQPADIRLIDFGAAQCGIRRQREAHAPTTDPEPISEIIERWRDYDDSKWEAPSDLRYPFLDLVDWEWDKWLRHEYLLPSQQVKA